MDRTFKFRGKRTDTGEWVYGYYVKGKDKHLIYSGETGFSKVSPAHVLMYEDLIWYEVIPETV
jgi:hypothetical protein